MFDVGFWELMLLGVVALLVVGPERMPGLARTAGLWFGKLRGFVQSVKQDIDQELKAEELQRILKEQANLPELDEIVDEIKTQARDSVQQTTQALAPPSPSEKTKEQEDVHRS